MNINFDVKIDAKIYVTTEQEMPKESQKILDSILARSSALVRKLEKVDALTPKKGS